MRVEKIDHIHVFVNDLDRAMRFFTDLLGKEFAPIWEGADFGVRTAYNRLGFDFIQPTDRSGPAAKTIKLQEEGICCVSLKVPNIEEAIAELESRVVKMIHRVEVGQLKEAWFEATNTFGVQIELCEYPGDDIVAASAGMQQ